MKKIISVLLVLCMALACVLSFTPAVCAADGPAFSVSGTTADIGDTITLTLTADKGGFTGAEIQLDYDKTCLKLVDVNLELSATGKDVYGAANKMATVPYSMLFTKASGPVDDETVLGNFTFEIVDAGKEDLSVAVGFTVGMPVVGGGTRLGQVVNGGTDLSASTSFTAGTVHVTGAPSSNLASDEYDYYYNKKAGGDVFEYIGVRVLDKLIFPAEVTNIDVVESLDDVSTFVFPETVESVTDFALEDAGVGDGAEYYFFNPEIELGEGSIGYYYDKKGREDLPCEDVIIHGWLGSTAETYATENGFEFKPIGEFKTIGAQNGTNAIRFISRMKYADSYVAAKVVISATGADDSGTAINKSAKELPVSCVYKTIKGSTGGTSFVAKSCPEGYYLSAVSIKNLPTFTGSGNIVFTVKTYVKYAEDGEFVELDSQNLTYDKNGYSGN